MDKLIRFANSYIRQSDWKDVAFIKLCLFSLGMLAGLSVAGRRKKPEAVAAVAAAVFIATYIPLMERFIRSAVSELKRNRPGGRQHLYTL